MLTFLISRVFFFICLYIYYITVKLCIDNIRDKTLKYVLEFLFFENINVNI